MDGGYGYRNKIILDVRGRLTRGVEAGGPALIVGTAHSAALKERILFCALRFHAMLDLWTCQAEQRLGEPCKRAAYYWIRCPGSDGLGRGGKM